MMALIRCTDRASEELEYLTWTLSTTYPTNFQRIKEGLGQRQMRRTTLKQKTYSLIADEVNADVLKDT